ncbi:unnamed protein product [Rhodiola kirilowii]
MGTRVPAHQLSNGLFVSGLPEQQPKDRTPTMSSRAVPYTGGDVKKSGELGKMFDILGRGRGRSNSPPSSLPPDPTPDRFDLGQTQVRHLRKTDRLRVRTHRAAADGAYHVRAAKWGSASSALRVDGWEVGIGARRDAFGRGGGVWVQSADSGGMGFGGGFGGGGRLVEGCDGGDEEGMC